MAAVETPSFVDPQNILDTWAASDGPTEEEKLAFANDALKELNSGKDFAENVKNAGVLANEIDDAFYKVTRDFEKIVEEHKKEFPKLSQFYDQWKGYKDVRYSFRLVLLIHSDIVNGQRWVSHLKESRDVASGHIALLRREFFIVFLSLRLIIPYRLRQDIP